MRPQNDWWQSGCVLLQSGQRHLDQLTDKVPRKVQLSVMKGSAASDKIMTMQSIWPYNVCTHFSVLCISAYLLLVMLSHVYYDCPSASLFTDALNFCTSSYDFYL